MIELIDLHFGYNPSEPIISDVSYSFATGAVTAVTGQSGSGKSTLLYLIGLMLSPTAGRIVLDGMEVSSLPDGQRSALRAERIGFVFQDAMLDPSRSLVDNVCDGNLYRAGRRDNTRRRAIELLLRLGVSSDPNRRPGQISGGQAQRVALCRALIGGADMVLADEPTGNLDHGSADTVWSTLSGLANEALHS